MLQIDGPRRRVYIKFVNEHRLNRTLRDTQGKQTYKHENGEQSQVIVELAGLGTREIMIANLSPEVNNRVVIEFLIKYGEVLEIKEEYWTSAYRYKIANGIRLVQIKLKHHIPSRLVISGHTVDVSYTGQPQTCFSCHQTGHIFQQCPHRRRGSPKEGDTPTPTWANIAAKNVTNTLSDTAIPSTDQTNAQYAEKTDEFDHNDKYTTSDAHHNNSDSNMRNGMETSAAAGGLLIDTSDRPEVNDVPCDSDRKHDEPRTWVAKQPVRGKSPHHNNTSDVHTKMEPMDASSTIHSQNDDLTEKRDATATVMETDTTPPNTPDSPKRNKKLKTEKDTTAFKERTRSKTRYATVT